MNRLSERSQAKITRSDLKKLLSIARENIKSFYERYPKYAEYLGKERLIALGQGAALHYIDKKNGVKDFDIWFFYPRFKSILPYRRKGVADFGPSKFGKHPDDKNFHGRKVDILMRSDNHFDNEDPGVCLQKYLIDCRTKTARKLSEKAMIGLYPDKYFGQMLWCKNK